MRSLRLKVWLWRWRHGSVAKLLKTQVHSCPNSSCRCLGWPWSTASTALTYIKLRPGPDQQPGSYLVFFTTNHKHLLNPLFCPLLIIPCSELYWFWTTKQKLDLNPNRCLFIAAGAASGCTNTTQVDQSELEKQNTLPQGCRQIEIFATLSKRITAL